MRPIDATALSKLIKEFRDDAPQSTTRKYVCNVILSMLGDENQTPTIDPESLRPQGEWVDIYDGKYANPRYACTRCGEKALYAANEKQKLSKSCPNCGAKMKGEQP